MMRHGHRRNVAPTSRTKQRTRPLHRALKLLFLAILLAFFVFTFLVLFVLTRAQSSPADPAALPTNAPSARSVQSASPIGDQNKNKEVNAAQIPLINFSHPNHQEPTDLVSLEATLPATVRYSQANLMCRPEVAAAANDLFTAAQREGVGGFLINSAFRTFSKQDYIYSHRLQSDPGYGNDPFNNPVKVVPSHASEHCAGLALDILSVDHPFANDAFSSTVQGQWLVQNAHKYGFILRYPDDKEHLTGVIYEPWHFRYVGVDIAADIHEKQLCLEEYVALPAD